MMKVPRFGISTLAVAFAATMFAGCNNNQQSTSEKGSKVTVMMYSEYIDPAMLDEFKARTGMEVQIVVYEDQDEMIGKLQASGTSEYDVIVASDVSIQQMIHLGLVAKMDTNKIVNRVNLADEYRHPLFDPTEEYAVPYLAGTTGILYRDTTISADSVSTFMLFDSTRTKGNFSILEESRFLTSFTLRALGLDANTTKKEDIDKVVETLLTTKKDKHFMGFDASVAGKNKVLSKMNWATICFNGEAMDAIDEDPELQYAIPVEGSYMWVDNMMLSSHAKNVEGAYAFINYILEGKAGAQLAKYVAFTSPNKESLKYLDSAYVNNNVVNPNAETMKRLVFLKGPGAASKLYDEAWTIIKSR